jgi:hypothetical protein
MADKLVLKMTPDFLDRESPAARVELEHARTAGAYLTSDNCSSDRASRTIQRTPRTIRVTATIASTQKNAR